MKFNEKTFDILFAFGKYDWLCFCPIVSLNGNGKCCIKCVLSSWFYVEVEIGWYFVEENPICIWFGAWAISQLVGKQCDNEVVGWYLAQLMFCWFHLLQMSGKNSVLNYLSDLPSWVSWDAGQEAVGWRVQRWSGGSSLHPPVPALHESITLLLRRNNIPEGFAGAETAKLADGKHQFLQFLEVVLANKLDE